MFSLIVRFAFPGEIVYHQKFFFDTEEELTHFRERVNQCPYTEIVDKVIIDGKEVKW